MKNRKGYAALMMALSFTVLCGGLAFAVDLGTAYYQRQLAQAAAESAVLGGASYARINGAICGVLGVLCQSTSTNCSTVSGTSSLSSACQYAAQNGFTDGKNNATVTVTSGTGTPPGTTGVTVDYWVQATVTQNIPMMFSAIFGNRISAVGASAVSATNAGPAGGSIYVLGSGPGTVTTDGTLSLNSGSNLYVNSSSSSAVQLSGHDCISNSGNTCLHVVGSCQQHGSSSISPAPQTGCQPQSDPYTNMQAPSSSTCDWWWDQNYSWGTNTLNPGTYCGDVTIGNTASVTFNPGTYVFKGNLTINTSGTVSGSGVTLYMQSGTCSMTSGNITLSPPTSGTYKGVTIYQDRSNTNQCTLTAGSTQCISGVIYAPAATISHCGGSSSNAPSQTIVCNKISFTGGTNVSGTAKTLYTASPGAICR